MASLGQNVDLYFLEDILNCIELELIIDTEVSLLYLDHDLGLPPWPLLDTPSDGASPLDLIATGQIKSLRAVLGWLTATANVAPIVLN